MLYNLSIITIFYKYTHSLLPDIYYEVPLINPPNSAVTINSRSSALPKHPGLRTEKGRDSLAYQFYKLYGEY